MDANRGHNTFLGCASYTGMQTWCYRPGVGAETNWSSAFWDFSLHHHLHPGRPDLPSCVSGTHPRLLFEVIGAALSLGKIAPCLILPAHLWNSLPPGFGNTECRQVQRCDLCYRDRHFRNLILIGDCKKLSYWKKSFSWLKTTQNSVIIRSSNSCFTGDSIRLITSPRVLSDEAFLLKGTLDKSTPGILFVASSSSKSVS